MAGNTKRLGGQLDPKEEAQMRELIEDHADMWSSEEVRERGRVRKEQPFFGLGDDDDGDDDVEEAGDAGGEGGECTGLSALKDAERYGRLEAGLLGEAEEEAMAFGGGKLSGFGEEEVEDGDEDVYADSSDHNEWASEDVCQAIRLRRPIFPRQDETEEELLAAAEGGVDSKHVLGAVSPDDETLVLEGGGEEGIRYVQDEPLLVCPQEELLQMVDSGDDPREVKIVDHRVIMESISTLTLRTAEDLVEAFRSEAVVAPQVASGTVSILAAISHRLADESAALPVARGVLVEMETAARTITEGAAAALGPRSQSLAKWAVGEMLAVVKVAHQVGLSNADLAARLSQRARQIRERRLVCVREARLVEEAMALFMENQAQHLS